MHFPLESYCLGTTGQLPISKNPLSENIGCDIDLTGGTKSKYIYTTSDPPSSCRDRAIDLLVHSRPGAVSRSPTCEIRGTSSYGDSPWSNSTPYDERAVGVA